MFCALAAAAVPVPVPAIAADLASADDPWTGFYAGIHGGLSDVDASLHMSAGALARSYDDLGKSSALVGLRAGYDFRFDRLVVGLQASVTLDNAKADVSVPALFTASAKRDWTVSGSMKAGMLIMPNTLIYALGGMSASRIKLKASWTLPAPGQLSGSDVFTGFHAGGGVEHLLTDNLSVNARYRFIGYSRKTYATSVSTIRIDPDIHEFTLGLTWRF